MRIHVLTCVLCGLALPQRAWTQPSLIAQDVQYENARAIDAVENAARGLDELSIAGVLTLVALAGEIACSGGGMRARNGKTNIRALKAFKSPAIRQVATLQPFSAPATSRNFRLKFPIPRAKNR